MQAAVKNKKTRTLIGLECASQSHKLLAVLDSPQEVQPSSFVILFNPWITGREGNGENEGERESEGKVIVGATSES